MQFGRMIEWIIIIRLCATVECVCDVLKHAERFRLIRSISRITANMNVMQWQLMDANESEVKRQEK